MSVDAVQRAAGAVVVTLFAATCADSPARPSGPAVSRVEVGVLGGLPARVSPQQTLQLYAVATGDDNGSTDVTNLATWSSSNSAIASVSAGGVVAGKSPGSLVVTARYGSGEGSIETAVAVMPCAASTLSPAALVFAAKPPISCSDFSNGQRVDVTASNSACRWTAVSDAPWLTLGCYNQVPTYTPGPPGTGPLHYTVLEPNNTPSARTGHITVSFDDGSRLVHTVTVEAPACSYTTSPLETKLPREGGEGSFEVVAVPANCVWRLPPTVYGGGAPDLTLSVTSGTGTQRVNYRVVNLRDGRKFTIPVIGVNNDDPYGVHTVLQGYP
jgi:hypothetical protein